MAVKSANSTFVYRTLNKDDKLNKTVLNIIQNGTILTRDNLQDAFLTIDKNFKDSLKLKVMESVNRGTIRLVYSPPTSRIPTAMPFFLTRDAGGQVIAFIAIDLIAKSTLNPETNYVQVDPKKLYTLMRSALLAIAYHERGNEISKRSIIISNGSSIYANMFARVLNKKYALNTNKSKLHKVQFLASKFYIINVLGAADSDSVFSYAMRNVTNGNVYQLRELDSQMKPEDYTDLSTFIQALTRPELGLGFKDLTVRGYMEAFINMYDAAAMLALEIFPYFMYNVLSVVDASYMNAQYVLEDIVDKNGAKMYNDLIDFVR